MIFAEQRLFRLRAELVQVSAHAQGDFLRIQNLARVDRRAVLGAASAFDARIRLQRDDVRQILAGVEPEILVAHERRNVAESRRAKEIP